MSYTATFELLHISELLPVVNGGTLWTIVAALGKQDGQAFKVTDNDVSDWYVSVNGGLTEVTVTMPADFIYPGYFSLYYSPDGIDTFYADIIKPYPVETGYSDTTINVAAWRWGSSSDDGPNFWQLLENADDAYGNDSSETGITSSTPRGYTLTPDSLAAPTNFILYLPEDFTLGGAISPEVIFYTDSTGALYRGIFTFTLESPESQLGSFIDATGVLYSAVNEATGVRISRFPSGAASRELLALIPNAKNADYQYERAKKVHLLSYEDRGDGAHKLVKSRDGGRTFSP